MGIIKDLKDVAKGMREMKTTKSINLSNPVLAEIFGTSEKKKLTSPYTQLSVVYAAIRAKAMNISQVPFRLYSADDKDGESEITTGQIWNLFQDINPYTNKFQLWESIVTLLDITGEGAVLLDSETKTGIPVALWPWHRDDMAPAFQGNVFTGWTVRINKQERFFPADQVIFNKYYNPHDKIRGLSPSSALKLSLDAEWGAVKYNEAFFDKGNAVGSVFSTTETLSDESFSRLRHELIGSRQGGNMHEALLLDGGVTLSNTRPSNRDLEFLELRKFTRQEVSMVYGVPESELSLYQDTKYTNAISADLGFWKKTLIPLMRLIQEEFNKTLLRPLGYRGEFDINSIDAVNSEIMAKAESAEKFFNIGFSRDQINKRLRLGFSVGDTEDIVKPMAIAQPVAPPEEKAITITGEMPKPINAEEITKRMRDAKWKSLMAPVLPLMAKGSKVVKDYFFDVEQRLLRAANKSLKSIVVKEISDDDLTWVDEAFSNDKLHRALSPVIEDSVILGVGQRFLPDETIIAMVAQRGKKITGINATAKNKVLSGLRSVLDDAIKEGLTETETAKLVNDSLIKTMGENKKHARTIARTETHGAYEEGRFESIKATNPPKKIWLSSRDDEVRDKKYNHDIDGEIVDFDKNFSNGLAFPLDPSGEAGNVINCRCTWEAIWDE